MTSTLLNIAGKIDSKIVAILETVDRIVTDLDIPYVIVGATARDLVLHYGHGARIERATQDVDFAIEVPCWSAFSALKDKLCGQGFKATDMPHRLVSPVGTEVDIIPFGNIEDKQASIAWPPKGGFAMSVLSFQDAFDSAERVRIQNEPELDVPVATPAGMALLKINAWVNREGNTRKKDATDIAYLLTTYNKIRDVEEAIYSGDNVQIMETYDYDIIQATSHLLGQHAKSIAQENTRKEIVRLANGEVKGLSLDLLAREMCVNVNVDYDNKQQLLIAFMSGFNG